MDGRSKIEIAREAVAGVLGNWKPEDELGLIAYGHRRKGDCGDIETLIPVGKLDAARFNEVVESIKPKGKTPLTAAVRQAAGQLKYTEDKATVILISDGRETCDADPCAAAEALEKAGVDFTVHVIGFDVRDKAGNAQLRCLAEKTGGSYFSAGDETGLKQALASAVKQTVEKHNFRIRLLPKAGMEKLAWTTDAGWKVYRVGSDGKPVKDYSVYEIGNWGGATLPAGRYVARVWLGAARAEQAFEIRASETTKLDVVLGAGDLKIRLLPKAGMEKLAWRTDAGWKVYRVGSDGKPVKDYSAYEIGNWGGATLPAGRYVARVWLGKGKVERRFEIKAGETTDLTVVVAPE